MTIVLTAPQPILQLPTYQEEVIADVPQVYYRMNETSGTTIVDEMGNSDGTISGTYTLEAGGAIVGTPNNNAITFTDGQVDCGFSTNYTTAFTLECWAFPGTQTGGLPHIITKNQYFASAFAEFPVRLQYTAADGFGFVLSSGNDFVADLVLTTGTVSSGYHHVVAVYRSSGLCELYLDGSLAASSTIAFSVSTNSRNWLIAQSHENGGGVGDSEYVGEVDEAAIYNYALSSSRILAHYNAGVTPYEDLILAESSLLSYWQLDETGTPVTGTAVDQTGLSNGTYNGTPTGGQTPLISTRTSVAFSGSGDDDYVQMATFTAPSPDITLEAWIQTSDDTQIGGIITHDDGDGSGSGDRNYQFRINAGVIEFIIFNTSAQFCTGAIDVADNSPHHVVGTYDGTTMHVYVDGVLDDSTSTSGTINTSTDNNMIIGARLDDDDGIVEDFGGQIDEVAIYDSALSLATIQDHYNAGLM